MVSLISRLYDFVSGTRIRSSQVDEELNQLVNSYDALVSLLTEVGVETCVRYGTNNCKYIRVNTDGAIEISTDGVVWTVTGSSGHLIYDKNGNFITQRTRMKFTNATVTDDGTYTVVNGIKGDTGATGATGATGRTATITIGNVSTGAAGSLVTLENVGTIQDAIWNISIPKGDKGAAWYPALDGLGNLTFTLSDSATPPPSYNIRGPQGPQGVQGAQGATGAQGIQGIQGVQGIQGQKGDKGADGSSFTVKGLYATLAALKAAHPTGADGDAYAVGDENSNVVYIWDVDAVGWSDVGSIQGPQGVQGPQGATGPQGPQGVQGVAGAAGTSAYMAATTAGYTGTETAFNTALAEVPNKADKKVPAATGNLAALDASGNLADSGKSADLVKEEVFIATYGTTTSAEIEAAFNAGKTIICANGNYRVPLIQKISTTYYFYWIDADAIIHRYRCSSSGWSETSYNALLLSGGTMTGNLALAADPTTNMMAATKQYVDNNAGAKIATGSYTGTGTYGSANPNSLTFDFVPQLVIVYLSATNANPGSGYWDSMFLYAGGMAKTYVNGTVVNFSLSGNTLSWYSTDASSQLNINNLIYYYKVFG